MNRSTRSDSGHNESQAPAITGASGWIPVTRFEASLDSPLRLQLLAELLATRPDGLSTQDAVISSGRHPQDVAACLHPMLEGQVVLRRAEGDGFMLNPALPGVLLACLEAATERKSAMLGRERHVRQDLFGGMIGMDPKMQLVFDLVRQVARIDVSVLVESETGTGKELVARAIHDLSPRRANLFAAVSSANLTEQLFESELFGHARGAFTGAVQAHSGLLEQCSSGTLFLDEVGELSLNNQVKLLRVLQEGTFRRVGETTVRHSDFRLICATNRDLLGMVSEGFFREDLYYRINVFPIRLPSLRERLIDLPILVDGILSSHARRVAGSAGKPSITEDALRLLARYDWPGNVRELENVVTRALILAGGGTIRPAHLPDLAVTIREMSDRPPVSLRSLGQMERSHIVRVLRRHEGNLTASAKVLEVSRTTLYKKIRDHEIDIDR